MAFTKYVTVTVPANLDAFALYWGIKFTEVFDFLTDWWEIDIQPILDDVTAWFAETGNEAFLVVLRAFVIFFNLFFSPVVQLLDNAWKAADHLLQSLKTLLKWIQSNPLSIPVGADLDPNWENDSPLVLHTKLMEFDQWIKDNPMAIPVGLKDTSSITGAASTTITSGNTFYIDNLILEGVQDKEGLLRQLEEAI